MASFSISVSSGCDATASFYRDHGLSVFALPYTEDGEEFFDKCDTTVMGDFFDRMRGGMVFKTAVPNAHEFIAHWEEILAKEGLPIIEIILSSALTSTNDHAMLAARQFNEAHPDTPVYPIDSLCASAGLQMLARKACQLRDADTPIDEAREKILDFRKHIIHWFSPSTLEYLKRMGRVSASSALVGAMLDIKPIMNINDDGALIVTDKVKGRKKAMSTLLTQAQQQAWPEQSCVYVLHADCEEDGRQLAQLAQEALNPTELIFGQLGPIIGGYTGPGLLGIIFLGEQR